jgi:hypothetical protein
MLRWTGPVESKFAPLHWDAGQEIDEHTDVLAVDIERQVTYCCAFS